MLKICFFEIVLYKCTKYPQATTCIFSTSSYQPNPTTMSSIKMFSDTVTPAMKIIGWLSNGDWYCQTELTCTCSTEDTLIRKKNISPAKLANIKKTPSDVIKQVFEVMDKTFCFNKSVMTLMGNKQWTGKLLIANLHANL